MSTKASELFSQKRAEFANAAPAPNAAPLKPQHTGLECPHCAASEPPQPGVPVFSFPGRIGFQCRNGHKYVDNDSLLMLNPKKIAVPKQMTHQDGYIELRLEIPSDIATMLKARFGERLAASVASVLSALCQEQSFVVSAEDSMRLRDSLGDLPKSGGALVGQVFNLKREFDQAKERARQVEQNQQSGSVIPTSVPEGSYVVSIDAGTREKLEQIAQFRGHTPSKVIAETVTTGIDAGWA